MDRQNLSQLAILNESHLQQRYAACLANASVDDRAVITGLHDRSLPEWRVVIGTGAFALRFWLQTGMPYNKYRWHAFQGDVVFFPPDLRIPGQTPVDWETLETTFVRDPNDRTYMKKRRAFNTWADSEEDFTYAAYSIDKRNAGEFGLLSIVLKRDFTEKCGLSVLRGDTLATYVDQKGDAFEVNEKDLLDDIASPKSATHLMCLKKSVNAGQGLQHCLETICCKSEYLEAHIPGYFDWTHVEEVYVPIPGELLIDIVAMPLIGEPISNERISPIEADEIIDVLNQLNGKVNIVYLDA